MLHNVTMPEEPYAPDSRRPIPNMFRATANAAVRFCAKHDIHPDTVSYASVVAAFIAAACFYFSGRQPWMLLAGPVFCYVRLWCNMLDGMVALETGKASTRGEVINELPDRVSDVVIFIGVAHSGLCMVELGYWAAILSVMTAYVGTLGQAVGAGRTFNGVMAKPYRMVVLHVAAWAMFVVIASGTELTLFGRLTLLDAGLICVIAGCLQTMVVRLRRVLHALDERG